MAFNTDQPPYRRLRSILAEKTSKVVVWTGSGVSTDAGLPTWPELRNCLLGHLREKAATMTEDASRSLRSAADRAERSTNYWVAFDILRKKLGRASFRDAIRESLQPALTSQCPSTYKSIWKLGVAGILNLNLDRLATRALSEVTPTKQSTEFTGRHAGEFLHSLKNPRPFVANLHGTADEASSWVFTKSDLKKLLASTEYQTFIRSCLATTTTLFVGISANDIAAGGQIEALTKAGLDVGAHYWLTDRKDLKTDQWAEESGIQLIRYENHIDIRDFFEDILTFVPSDGPHPPPVVLQDTTGPGDKRLPSRQKLAQWPAEKIREVLNAHAKRLFNSGLSDPYSAYEQFSLDYDEPIYRAWYTSVNPPGNKLFGYKLLEQVGKGAFGRVYRAIDAKGNQVAVKVLLEDIRRDQSLLQSFRRGVRSMQFLADHDVEGMVAYRKASEIPAFVVMDWIEGPSLSAACATGRIHKWDSILKIGWEMTDVIYRAHSIPERVLHRDIRPSNIMLENFFEGSDDWRVVVLDFDLSWHQGALEQSVIHGPVLGYLAPEQMQTILGASTRHAAVDSFGVGMTLYYIIAGNDPVPTQHLHRNWSEVVEKCASVHQSLRWTSLPSRYARLITRATQNQQSDRWDMSQIRDELGRLRDTYSHPDSVQSAELVAEEIVSRSGKEYEWNDDRLAATVELASGSVITVTGDESGREVVLHIQWSSSGQLARKHVGKWMRSASQRCVATLRSSGWKIRTKNFDAPRTMVIEAALSVSSVVMDLSDHAGMLSQIMGILKFD